MQVMFETDFDFDIAILRDAYALAGERGYSPVAKFLTRAGLDPASHRVYNPNRRALAAFWTRLLDEIYAREFPSDESACDDDEASTGAFWACLRRAYPNAQSDAAQRAGALSNLCLMFSAGIEATSSAVSLAAALLAMHPAEQDEIAAVRALAPALLVQ